MPLPSPPLHLQSGRDNWQPLKMVPRAGAGAVESVKPRPEFEVRPFRLQIPACSTAALKSIFPAGKSLFPESMLPSTASHAHGTTAPITHQRHRDSCSQDAMRSRSPFGPFAHCKLGVEVHCRQVAGRCQHYKLFALGFLLESNSQGQ